ncbi:MAG: hypothetical protein EOP42_18800 [Sphingobacteriaceae bacterium]|nr:MAG: hypothetical protein EOP42_18800 [Sphingobacteriaceae bacterium]
MIIYHHKSLANLYIQQQAEKAHNAHLITSPELNNIKENYPVNFYTPNLVIRIGFFVLTLIGCLFAGLLLSLIFEGTHITDHAVWPLLLGLGTYAVLELIVKEKRLFKAGIDDALIWQTAALLAGSFAWAVADKNNEYLFVSGFVLLLSLYLTLRFADTLMSAVAFLSFLALIFFSWSKAGTIGEMTMPFVMMLISFLIFYRAGKAQKDAKFINYYKCLACVQLISLLTLYAAGNYFVVLMLSSQLHNLPAGNNADVPFSWFFWLYTMLVPFVYSWLGIKNKSLLLLRTGLLLVALAALTFRMIFHVLPTEYALVLSGTVLLLSAFMLIKYLKTPKNGFTYTRRSSKHWVNNINLESLIVAQAAHAPSAPAPDTERFGGGSFGGGGSGSDF